MAVKKKNSKDFKVISLGKLRDDGEILPCPFCVKKENNNELVKPLMNVAENANTNLVESVGERIAVDQKSIYEQKPHEIIEQKKQS